MNQKLKLISSAGDLIIPILLFYGWNWDLHYILLFIYIDLFASIVIANLKERKILATQSKKSKATNLVKQVMRYLTLGLIGIVIYELAILNLYPEMNLWTSFLDFLWEKEFGIPQIVLLIPLLFWVNYQQYQMLFIRSRQHQVLPLSFVQTIHSATWILFVGGAAIFYALSFVITEPLDIFLFLLLSVKLLSDLLVIPKIEQKALHKLLNSPHVHTR